MIVCWIVSLSISVIALFVFSVSLGGEISYLSQENDNDATCSPGDEVSWSSSFSF